MSYAVSAALQQAVYRSLKDNPAIAEAVGDAVYDVVPAGKVPSTYISLGPEEVRERSDKTGRGAQHDFIVSVVTEAAGFHSAKLAAGAVSDALVDAQLELSRGVLVSLTFLRGRAVRVEDARIRRIDLRFRAYVDDTGSITSENT